MDLSKYGTPVTTAQPAQSASTPFFQQANDSFSKYGAPVSATPQKPLLQSISDTLWQTPLYDPLQRKSVPLGETPAGAAVKAGTETFAEGARIAGGGSASDVLGGGMMEATGLAHIIGSPLAGIFGPAIQKASDVISELPTYKAYGDQMLSKGGAQTKGEGYVESTAEAAGLLGLVGGAEGTIKAGINGVKKITSGKGPDGGDVLAAGEDLTAAGAAEEAGATASLDSQIVDNYTRAVKPTIVGKQTATKQAKYNEDVLGGVDSILKNEPQLSYKDEATGEAITGRTPETPSELTSAVDQVKSLIFKAYDELAQKTGKGGTTVDLNPIITQLKGVMENEAINTVNPSASKYAESWMSRLVYEDGTMKAFSTTVAQDVIKMMNSALESFYRNPSYESAGTAAIDAGIVRLLREQLDKAIENAPEGAKGYQKLKSQYASLKAIEKDVAKRAIVLARQTNAAGAAGLGKYMDVFSSGDMVSGILSQNPALFAKGVAQAGLTRFFQHMNSPERAIKLMFEAAKQKARGGAVKKIMDSAKKGEGFSVSIRGTEPKSGYMVAPSKGTETVGPPTPKSINAFINKFADELSSGDMYIGGWVNEAGELVMDPAKNVKSPQETATIARQGNQDAVWSVDEQRSIGREEYDQLEKGTGVSGESAQREGGDASQGGDSGRRDVGVGGAPKKGSGGKGGGVIPKDEGAAPKTEKSQPRITRIGDFDRNPNLSQKDKAIETRALERVLANEDKIIADYLKENGKRVNTDDFRPLFEKDGYNGKNSAAVHEPSSYLAKRVRTILLQQKGKYAYALGGGSGVGKTSAAGFVKKLSEIRAKSAVILDTNFSKLPTAESFIKEAQAAGKKFIGTFTYRSPKDAIYGIVQRALTNKKEMGRIVPNSETAKNHIGSWDVAQNLSKRGFMYRFIDNSGKFGTAKLVQIEELAKKIHYPPEAELKAFLDKEVQRMYKEKTPFKDEAGKTHYLTPEQVKAFLE